MASQAERWSHKEISDFLEICKERGILKRMNNKSYRFDEILQDIKSDMDSLGYSRTIHQMSLKFKKLRQRYKQCLQQNPTGKRLRRQFEFFDILHKMEYDRRHQEESDNEWEPKYEDDEKYSNSENHSEQIKDPVSLDIESKTYAEEYSVFSQLTNNERNGKRNVPSISEYAECFQFLVSSFKSAQEELQQSFFNQQLLLQQQQQEWEERILDEEREYFAKLLNSFKSKHS